MIQKTEVRDVGGFYELFTLALSDYIKNKLLWLFVHVLEFLRVLK